MAAEAPTVRQRAASERGAVLIQVGVAILVLSAFAMFIIDYGALWVSRHQAQNAADSGALAGAIALAFDDFDDRSDTGPAKTAAQSFAQVNGVFGESPDVDMATDVRFYNDAPGAFPASCATDDCIRVDVYRNQARGNALPTFFGHLVGVTDQGVRAMAIARAAAANASDCLKPWAVLDKWLDSSGTWTTESDFDPLVDTYTAPTGSSTGTSYTLEVDLGLKLDLKINDPLTAMAEWAPGMFSPLNFCGTGGGVNCYRDAITGCAPLVWKIGDDVPVEPGNYPMPTINAVQELIALDPGAEWDPVEKKVINSCVGPPYTCSTPGYKTSPRLVALPVVNTSMWWDAVHNDNGGTVGAGGKTARIVAILGFFIDELTGTGPQQNIVGYLATKPDILTSNGGSVSPSAAFLKTVTLVR
jgi:Flp pilus assembly protein TadG